MPVYVDDCKIKYKGMIMSHMIADSHSELLAMVDEIGLDRKHIQYEGTRKEHFDVCQSYKKRAINAGATQIKKRELVKLLIKRNYQDYDY